MIDKIEKLLKEAEISYTAVSGEAKAYYKGIIDTYKTVLIIIKGVK